MNRNRMAVSLMACCVVMASGCTSTIAVVPKAQHCDVDSTLLAGDCASPQRLATDATYEQLVSAMLEDRHALLKCGVTFAALRDSLNRCNQQIDAFNAEVESINRTNAARK